VSESYVQQNAYMHHQNSYMHHHNAYMHHHNAYMYDVQRKSYVYAQCTITHTCTNRDTIRLPVWTRVRGTCAGATCAVCCSVLQCVVACCSVWQCVAVLQRVAACCSVHVKVSRVHINSTQRQETPGRGRHRLETCVTSTPLSHMRRHKCDKSHSSLHSVPCRDTCGLC